MDKSQKYKQSNVQVWFLDENLEKSAEYLTTLALTKSIDGAVAALESAVFYFIGIRNKKAYQYYFDRERKDETMSRFFPCWPFRKHPAMRYYTSRASKWTRQCGEHFEYMTNYLRIMLDEYGIRYGRRHTADKFLIWVEQDMLVNVPKANIKDIHLPWKSLKQKWRRKDIIEGYRLQYLDTFCWGDPVKAYESSNRDIPEFVVRHFHMDTAGFLD